MSIPFTCNTCKLEFEGGELQRAHMHTEYHGYNLKRKIASLAPIPAEVFDRGVSKSREVAVANGGISKPEEAMEKVSLDTQPHKVLIEMDYTSLQCLFCNIDSPTTDDNVEHMLKVHGMFIPDNEDLEDAEGLLTYLFNIIAEFRECLYCGKTKETVGGIQSHMIDKGHCKIAFDEELDQFYDFEGGSEDGAEEEMIGEDEEHVEADKTPSTSEHDFHPDSDHELRLPSGRVLGHRSLSRYYRQNLHSYPTPAERAERRAITAAEAANGERPIPHHPGRQLATSTRDEMGMIGVSEFEKQTLKATEKKALKEETRARNEHEWRVNKESNHQKHYRPADPGRSNG
ncbi:MAG: hypothetical protein ALECFALPRED_003064 [Alectoria fallacina]|uniref:C2H2-type domain-containing protein n=1 Tax=Alectoria fallacina TaxID=1903189 RepID=A0A8H3EKK8_9LECA|nr:MAG: hypothetical protein ALECFALPRED_003064 [Alectoria fallacina]